MNVTNRRCIRRLSLKSMLASRSRNIIAILAIALTTLLFTTLFTIVISMNHAAQENNFRMVGGYSHGGFKYLTAAQRDELKTDPLIQEYGLRLIVGMPLKMPFNKTQVEVSYCNDNGAKWMYAEPSEGRLPAEGTQEAATDLRVLSLLGVEPEIGAAFTMTFDVDGQETTETFTLSGWWDYDSAIIASHVLLPESRARQIFDDLDTQGHDGMTGLWTLDIILDSSAHIERDILTILANHGYQNEIRDDDTYISTGVNWAYTGAQLTNSLDPSLVLAIAALLLVILFTGYLIIYNVFQISVANDIRYYGLLKTIGVTGRQLKRMIRLQALSLSLLGIPVGLLPGYVIGIWLTPVILSNFNGFVPEAVSVNPLIFVGAALFSLLTVLISCRRPGKIAAKTSPLEAVRYNEVTGGKKTLRKGKKGALLSRMALANLGRSRKKTVITMLSLSLAAVLLNLTYTFTVGFDMDRYLAKFVVSDFILADAGYFQVGGNLWGKDMALSEEIIATLGQQSGILEGGRTYGQTVYMEEYLTEEHFRKMNGRWSTPEDIDSMIDNSERKDNWIVDNVRLFGMEDYVLDKLNVVEGDLTKLYEAGSRSIAAVYLTDDYDVPQLDSHWAKVGDRVTLRRADELEYLDPDTGEVLDDIPENGYFWSRAKKYQELEYEVVALVTVPSQLSYRFYGTDEFVLNAQTFIQDTGTSDILYYAYDTADEANGQMEAFLQDFTENRQPQYDYESKETYAASFSSFRNMFLIMGGVLCFIIGLVGVLNFLNATITSIISRRRELAMLQAIGMTSSQAKALLIWEGLYHTLGAVLLSLLLFVATGPLLRTALESMIWFFRYRFTVAPLMALVPVFAALGVLLPMISLSVMEKHSMIERLREEI